MSEEKVWVFDGTNFGNWKFRIEVLMEDKGLLDCLESAIEDEEYAKELPEDSAAVLAEKKKKLDLRISRDRKCKQLLIHRIGEDQLDYVKDKRTAKEAWDALKNAFERVGIAGKLLLKKQFQELRLKEGGDIKSYLLQFGKVLREMKAAGVKIEEEDVVCQLLLCLPESYNALITAVETIQPEQLTLDYVKKWLLDESVKRINSKGSSEKCPSESAFGVKKAGLKCFECGKFGHKRTECAERGNSTASGSTMKRKPPQQKWNKRNSAHTAHEREMSFFAIANNSVCFMSSTTRSERIEWFLDSGATDHMVNNK